VQPRGPPVLEAWASGRRLLDCLGMRGRALFLYAVCCVIWGSTWLVIKLGLADLPPFLFAGLRMAIACAILTPIALRSVGRAQLREFLGDIALAGFLQIGLSYAFVFLAEKTVGSGLTAVLFSTFPIWIGLFAHLLLPEEPWKPVHLASAALGLGGVLLLELPALRGLFAARTAAAASLLPLLAAAVSALSNVWIKKRLGRVSPAVNLWGETLVGAAFLLLLALVFERSAAVHWTLRSVAALGYLSLFGTVVTFLALFWLIPRVPLATIGAIPLIDTAIAVVLGAAILREPLGPRLIAGAALVLCGVGLINLARPEPEVSAPEP
jgi:drug/metabolite transporter (DMT)-like permease